jgi:hypothetical protein
MHARTAVAALMVLLLPTADARVTACDCISLQPLSAAVRKEAPVIFEGKVVEIVERSLHTLRSTSGGGSSETTPMGREVIFEVTRAWNGVTTKRITIESELSDCMFPFAIDHSYVVFSWKDTKGVLSTGSCSRTMESNKAADLIAALGPATTLLAR